ncbi:T9SS type A sorting domain-containing protein [Flavobacterium sp. GCM10023249]|uniref:T9SS type A sorting domain-containing protein n=1 Tax=unclassified Flavobacterium TaxID=196869 RepID=UPI003614120B
MKTKLFLLLFLSALSGSAQCWQKIDSGMYHTLALASNGTLWSWGYNNAGQLGDGTIINRTQPVQIGTATDWVSVHAGYYHSFAIKADGTLWGWGQGANNRLGYGGFAEVHQPMQIGTATNWAKVSGGETFSIGLKTDGTIWVWGIDTYGQMGNGLGGGYAIPTQLGVSTDNKDVEAGRFHVVLLKNNGNVYTWGNNDYSQIGNGNVINQDAPYLVPGTNNFIKIEAGTNSSVAIKDDGTLFLAGMIPNSAFTSVTFMQLYPSHVWANVKVTDKNFVGVKPDGSIWTYGLNTYGQNGLGLNTTALTVPLSGSDYSSNIGLNIYSLLVLKNDGTLHGTGQNHVGQLGDNTTVQKSTITAVACPAVLDAADFNTNLNFQVYPNPVQEVLRFSSSNNATIDNVVVYDVSGKKVLQVADSIDELNVEKLAKGYYTVEITSEGKKTMKKIIKE